MPEDQLRTISVRDIMGTKKLISIDPNKPVRQVSQILSNHGIGAVPVLVDRQVIGIVSERDISRNFGKLGPNLEGYIARQIMTSPVTVVSPNDTIDDAQNMMRAGGFRHLPVVEDGYVINIISLNDITERLSRERERLIQDLMQYLHQA